MTSDKFARPTYTNEVGTYSYAIWYSSTIGMFIVDAIAEDSTRGNIGYVDSYVDGERLFHDWLAHNEPLSSEQYNNE